ncbi:NACHT domain-containing protein [Ancylomarina euxinus]|uniref:NACHT domain-containing protein n=1 Tax=Ancylomarina euxinus TaxID=2283627 RepID=A0A425Y6S6_9BACT|nr:NACHT domain-containing protein [Ancylomarina euxinus]MCZ4693903.1 dsDNA nuclease domain-containing protein [Ancylomarina euxinus]MUP14677.1 NACHT domain-containing protein [Ancylomarina euxinus]RRG24223.1 NACHT domain-containing protein [Ancylomarina euxinus]
MAKTEFHVFKRNTDAIATNRGFYYQYLVTIKLWLVNYIEGKDNNIYCELEDDIFEHNPKTNTYALHQVKCYAEGFGLNSPEIKSSLLNFFYLFLKYKENGNCLFHFETNAFFRPKAGKSLKKWYNNQQKGNFSPDEFIDETRKILNEFSNSNLNKYLARETDHIKIEQAKKKVSDFSQELLNSDFTDFLKALRWEFSGENDTEKAVLKLLKEIRDILSSEELKCNEEISENLLLGYILNTVIEKSTTKDKSKRLLTNNLLQTILNSVDIEDKLSEKLRPEIITLMNNDFHILNEVNVIHKKVDILNDTVNQINQIITTKGDSKQSLISNLTSDVKNWFTTIGYSFEGFESIKDNQSEFIINIPNRRGYDRILILCVAEPIDITHFEKLRQDLEKQKCDEGWAITFKRIDKSVRKKAGNCEHKNIFCYTIDELLDESINFTGYFDWLEDEVKSTKIDTNFIPLYCKKEVFDNEKKLKLDTNEYPIDKYIDQWIDDPAKKHISVLGEFGTGKTWFTIHYAWKKLQQYKSAKHKGINRPRIPIVIPLRDFAKAVNIESVFSEFFFKKYDSPIPTYNAFVELNKMGKLLLIFDGFDEMADKVDTQKMINNFWELARTITENSKVILTCRNEHFPEAKKGRELLNAELNASTQHLIAETPQFEVLELLKFNEKQIKKLLSFYTNSKTIKKIMKNKALLELASRPIMTELILESLKDIEEGKAIDISRVYLYAIKQKFTKDIKEERTFTSIPDKLYFMCELAWEMLSTDKMSINYRLFPDRIRELFNESVKEQKDIDHWQYDMMGQTMLIRNDEGDYKPAHRSFLEFFVAYKFAAELGILDDDFTKLARNTSSNEKNQISNTLKWSEYFKKSNANPLSNFKKIELCELKETFGKKLISKALLDLVKNMISINSVQTNQKLNDIITECKNKKFSEIGYIATNIIIMLVENNADYFADKDLSNLNIPDFNIPQKEHDSSWNVDDYKYGIFKGTKFSNSDLSRGNFGSPYSYNNKITSNHIEADFSNSNLTDFNFHKLHIKCIDISNGVIALGSPHGITILDQTNMSVIRRINADGWHVKFSPNGKYFAHSSFGYLCIRDAENFELIINHKLSEQINPKAQEDGRNFWTGEFIFSNDSKIIHLGCNNAIVYSYDIEKKEEINSLMTFEGAYGISLSHDENYLSCSEFNAYSIWDLRNNNRIKHEYITKKNNLDKHKVKFHPQNNIFIVTNKNRIRFYDILKSEFTFEKEVTGIRNFCFSKDGKIIYAQSSSEVYKIDFEKKEIIKTYHIELLKIKGDRVQERIMNIYLNEDELNLYIITEHQIALFNFDNEIIIDTYQLMPDQTGTIFSGSKGFDRQFAIQLKRNGAIID